MSSLLRLRRISGAVGFFVVVIASKLGSAQLLRAISAWQVGPEPHLWVVHASSHLVSCLVKDQQCAD